MQGSLKIADKIPDHYGKLKLIQKAFINCYGDQKRAEENFKKLIYDSNSNFSRYYFFYANYLLHNDKSNDAKKLIKEGSEKFESNLLLEQTRSSFLEKNYYPIIKAFNCKSARDNLAEIFYIFANLYSSDENYNLSNFFLRISMHLNNNFIYNKALLAENYFYQKQFNISKEIYADLKSAGKIYSWYSNKKLASIISKQKNDKESIVFLKKEFNRIKNPNKKITLDLANFYMLNDLYEDAIKYYSFIIDELELDSPLLPHVLKQRGKSYERIDQWDKAEKDLLLSLEILPEQPYVLNYLAYSWIEKQININKSLEMLKKANQLKENDPYITDSLGWAFYLKENYIEAEKLLRSAVQKLPLDPIINDHYGDILWKLKKEIQARYFWNFVLNLDDVDLLLKDKVRDKLLNGLKENS